MPVDLCLVGISALLSANWIFLFCCTLSSQRISGPTYHITCIHQKQLTGNLLLQTFYLSHSKWTNQMYFYWGVATIWGFPLVQRGTGEKHVTAQSANSSSPAHICFLYDFFAIFNWLLLQLSLCCSTKNKPKWSDQKRFSIELFKMDVCDFKCDISGIQLPCKEEEEEEPSINRG